MEQHGGNIYKNKVRYDFSSSINPFGMAERVRMAAIDSLEFSARYPDPSCRKFREKLAAKCNAQYSKFQPENFKNNAGKQNANSEYSVSNAENSERESVASKYSLANPDSYLIGSGVAELIYALIFYVQRQHPGTSAYFAVPTFSEYKNASETAGLHAKEYFLKEEDDFNFTDETADDFLRNIPEDCSIIFFCNPGNPNGQLIEHRILSHMVDAILNINASRIQQGKYPILICVDESFLPLTGKVDESFMPHIVKSCENTAHLGGKLDNTTVTEIAGESSNPFSREVLENSNNDASINNNIVILRSFTKLYAMAGLRLGYMFGEPQLLSEIRNFMQPWNVSIPAQCAGEAAMELDEYVETSLRLIDRERDYLFKNLDELKLHPLRSDSNYILFSYDKDRQENRNSLFEMLKISGILIRDCSNFDGLSNGFYRIAVRTRVENAELLQTLREIVLSAEQK